MKTLIMAGVLLLLLVGAANGAADDAATRLVERTAGRMLATLQAERAAIDRNPQRINQLVDSILAPHFDFEMITRAAVGRDWNSATPAQQRALTQAFRETLVRTYAQALLKYSGQEIIYEAAKPGTRTGTVVVPTQVRGTGGAPAIPIDYRMHRQGGAWKVYDVIIENVSLIANYRGQFRTTIGRSGIDGLIRELETRNRRGV
ncbi:MAG: ABC transporter substrate-binding protein [Chromatiaceae bacterium]|nr:MAG: ABC transporter substrate-binding protein [Chromatiaceae bacterium]